MQRVPLLCAGIHAQFIAGNGIAHRNGVFLRLLQSLGTGLRLRSGLRQTFTGIRPVPLGVGLPVHQLLHGSGCSAEGGFFLRRAVQRRRLFLPQMQQLCRRLICVGRELSAGLQGIGQVLLQLHTLGLDFGNTRLPFRNLVGQTAGPAFMVTELLPEALHIGSVVFIIGSQNCSVTIALLPLCLQLGNLFPQRFRPQVTCPQGLRQLFRLPVQTIQGVLPLLENERRGAVILFSLPGRLGQFLQAVQPDRHLQPPQLITVNQKFFCLLCLDPQRLHLQLQLREFIPDPHQIVFRTGELALRILFPVAVLGDARRLFKDFTPVGTFHRQDLVNTALSNIGIAFTAKTRIHKQFIDVLQTG